MQTPRFFPKQKRWGVSYMCKNPMCLLLKKKPRHTVYAKLKRQLTHEAINKHQDQYHMKSHRHKLVDGVLERNHSSLTFEDLHNEVLAEYGKKDDDNQSAIIYQEEAFSTTKTSGDWQPPFYKNLYEAISPDNVFDWYLQLEAYMLKNISYHGKTFKDGKFTQIYNGIKRISEHAVLHHKAQPIRNERVEILAKNIKANLRSNYRNVEGETKPFSPEMIARLIQKVNEIAMFEDPSFKYLSEFFNVSIGLVTRAGETCGLFASDVKFGLGGQRSMAHIQRQLKYTPKTPKIVELQKKYYKNIAKTKSKADRWVPLSSDLEQFFQGVALGFDTGERKNDNMGNPTLWQYDDGTPMTPNNFRDHLKSFIYKYGQDFLNENQEFGYSLHALRHAGASFLQAETNDIGLVSRILGHATISITADRYGHAVTEQLRNAPDMSKILKGVSD